MKSFELISILFLLANITLNTVDSVERSNEFSRKQILLGSRKLAFSLHFFFTRELVYFLFFFFQIIRPTMIYIDNFNQLVSII